MRMKSMQRSGPIARSAKGVAVELARNEQLFAPPLKNPSACEAVKADRNKRPEPVKAGSSSERPVASKFPISMSILSRVHALWTIADKSMSQANSARDQRPRCQL